jgi:hypothetical protein
VVCHQAAQVGAGVRVGGLPHYAAHNDLGTAALLASMHNAGVDRLVLASSMVVYGEGRYSCVEHGVQKPRPRSRPALDAGDFENACPRCGAASNGSSSTRTRGSIPAAHCRQQGCAETTRRPGSGRLTPRASR